MSNRVVPRSALARVLLAGILALASRPAVGAVNAWEPIGPDGGDVTGLLLVNPTALYAGTVAGGVFMSADGGASWTSKSEGLPSLEVRGLAADPRNPTTLFAASFLGLAKTTDGGAHWALTSLVAAPIHAVVVDPRRPQNVFAATDGGVFGSRDGGDSWTPGTGFGGRVLALALDTRHTPSRIYAATEAGVWKSTDEGGTWTPTGLTSGIVTVLAPDPRDNSTLFAATDGGLYRSINAGDTWSPAGLGDANIRAIAPDPRTDGIIYVGTPTGVLKRDTRGTWRATDIPVVAVNALVVDPRQAATVYAGTSRGLYKSVGAGVGWLQQNVGLRALDLSVVAIDERSGTAGGAPKVLYAAAPGIGVFRSTNGGSAWFLGSNGLPSLNVNTLALDSVNTAILYAGTDAGVAKSGNWGLSWAPTALSTGHVAQVVVDPFNSNTVFAATDGGVEKSTNGGQSWNPHNSGLTGFPATAIAVDKSAPGRLYVATNAGVFKTTNGGGTWTPSVGGLPGAAVTAIAVDPSLASTVLAATNGGVFKSVNGGANWSPSSTGLPAGGVVGLAVEAGSPSQYYAATPSGVFRSANGGASWTPLNDGLTNLDVSVVAIDGATPPTLYAGTNGSSVFKREIVRCQTNTDCDDRNLCTTEVCSPNDDVANSAGCIYTNAVECVAADGCHEAGVCDPLTGLCTNPERPDGTTCDDLSVCTTDDACKAGACTGTPRSCNDQNPCTTEVCEEARGCVYTKAQDGSECDDGDSCTVGEQCADGLCVPAQRLCDDEDACTRDICKPGGVCEHQAIPAGGLCNDGNPCTQGETCQGGACQGGQGFNCDDLNPCTIDSCNPTRGCQYVAAADNTPCNDNNACTQLDVCQGGVCAGALPIDCGSATACKAAGVCNPQNGRCSQVLLPNGTQCDDGDPCTAVDGCVNGGCLGSGVLNCDDHNECTTDSCKKGTGCLHDNNSRACDDGNACTRPDFCANGICTPGPARSCDDRNNCTEDSCSPIAGCINAQLEECTPAGSSTTTTRPRPTTTTTTLPDQGAPCTTINECTASVPCSQPQCIGGRCVYQPFVGVSGIDCLINDALTRPMCGQQQLKPAKLARAIRKRLIRARGLVMRADRSARPGKRAKTLRLASTQCRAATVAVRRAGFRGKISLECSQELLQLLQRLHQAIRAMRTS